MLSIFKQKKNRKSQRTILSKKRNLETLSVEESEQTTVSSSDMKN